MLKKSKNTLSSRNKKAAQFLVLIGMVVLPVMVFTGCKSFSCTWCGSSSTFTPLCASGTSNGVEYSSCIGPAAVLSCGLNTCLWPTECSSVKFIPSSGNEIIKGRVCYYDSCGCIDGEDSMSIGYYSTFANCGGCATCGVCNYKEEVYSDKTVASTGCVELGCNTTETDLRNYNDSLPRQYPKGCCTVFDDEE